MYLYYLNHLPKSLGRCTRLEKCNFKLPISFLRDKIVNAFLFLLQDSDNY